jgi:anti-sigma B factor antagonist
MAPVARIISLPTGSVLVQLLGELDVATVPAVSDHLVRAMNLSFRVVVDLREVTFIDAATIGALAQARQRVVVEGGDLVLVGATPSIGRVLRLAHVTDVLPQFPDLRSALVGAVARI